MIDTIQSTDQGNLASLESQDKSESTKEHIDSIKDLFGRHSEIPKLKKAELSIMPKLLCIFSYNKIFVVRMHKYSLTM